MDALQIDEVISDKLLELEQEPLRGVCKEIARSCPEREEIEMTSLQCGLVTIVKRLVDLPQQWNHFYLRHQLI